MSIHPGMKMLAAVVVLFLAVGMSDSVILNKCELKQQLQTGLTLPPNMTDVLAQIVCHVQLTSNFNTSAIKTIAEPQNSGELHGPRKGRSAKSQGKNKGRPSIKVTSPPHLESAEDKNEVWTLYGLFQLSNHVVCNSTQSHSLNLCGLTCDKLLDDNISDDMACVQVLINKMTAVIPDPKTAKHIRKMISLIYQPECVNAKASVYFADCP
ncbi:lysozyme C, milk isozyme [Pimephales promelas]|uniref:lysozyme C, milk isozyme n=1 Tax=Pimephales promelas TaxID=90988 RepID=UPI0019555705|nr:lysozyme C, milk isozyme [Pimephales promelas]KAG1956001.1 vegetative cell wall protein gp1-like [Pimephales promelas]KAG1956002.1 vegetative cell wall protein gp1-like [Pimephales promelas]